MLALECDVGTMCILVSLDQIRSKCVNQLVRSTLFLHGNQQQMSTLCSDNKPTHLINLPDGFGKLLENDLVESSELVNAGKCVCLHSECGVEK